MRKRQRLIALAATILVLLTVTPVLAAGSRCLNLSGAYMLQGEDGHVLPGNRDTVTPALPDGEEALIDRRGDGRGLPSVAKRER